MDTKVEGLAIKSDDWGHWLGCFLSLVTTWLSFS